jgi:hypothetical protein
VEFTSRIFRPTRRNRFPEAYEAFKARVSTIVDMPDRLLDLLFRFLRQNGGTLSRRAREREFAGLTDAEAAEIDAIFAETNPEAATAAAQAR